MLPIRKFKLAEPGGDGRHAYVTESGAFIGYGVPLLDRDAAGRWKPRDKRVLDRLFAKGYETQLDLDWRIQQLGHVARALNRGEISLAGISLLRAELPPLPSEEAARAMAKANESFAKYNPDVDGEIRVAAGDDGAGRWTTGDGNANIPKRVAVPVRAISQKHNNVLLENNDGSADLRSGGSLAWRNNNPGNLENGPGAIGSNGGFAVFPDEETGTAAQRHSITVGYKNSTIDSMIAAWAPPKTNNTALYQRQISQWSGLPGTAQIRNLSADQISSLMSAQRRKEGWITGTVTRIKH